MQLGAHVRTAGGIATSIARARDLGCESLQIFSSNPRGWQRALPKDEHITAFNAAQEAARFGNHRCPLSFIRNTSLIPVRRSRKSTICP